MQPPGLTEAIAVLAAAGGGGVRSASRGKRRGGFQRHGRTIGAVETPRLLLIGRGGRGGTRDGSRRWRLKQTKKKHIVLYNPEQTARLITETRQAAQA